MKGVGFGTILVLVIAAVGFITWSHDTCTVRMLPWRANVTLEGWGSSNACSEVVNAGSNRIFMGLSLGQVGAQYDQPSGDLICSGFSGVMHYEVRDQSLTGLYIMGTWLCASLEHTSSSSPSPPSSSPDSSSSGSPPPIASPPPAGTRRCQLKAIGKGSYITVWGPDVDSATCQSLLPHLYHNTWNLVSPPIAPPPNVICLVPSSLMASGDQGDVRDENANFNATSQNACQDLQQ